MKIDIEMRKSTEEATDIKNYICKVGLTAILDQKNTQHFETFILTLINGGLRKLLLDLSELKHIDSSGIGKIINISKCIRKMKGNITITKCNPDVNKTLKLVKLGNFVSIFASNDEGFNYLALI